MKIQARRPRWLLLTIGLACVVWGVSRAAQVGWSFWAMPWLVAGCVCIYLSWHAPARGSRQP